MKEIWKDIEGFPNYEVSNMGNVRNKSNGVYLKQFLDNVGYLQVNLCNNDGHKSVRVHTLVAEGFLGARPEGYDINHEDGNKTNNNVSNLSYCTRSANVLHAYANGLNATTHSIKIVETGEVFNSISECARAINGNPKNILQCLEPKYSRKMCNGYHFEYVSKSDVTRTPIPIEIVETGEVFNSARECERAIGGHHRNITKAIELGKEYNGLHFKKVTSKPEKKVKPFLYPHQKEAVEKMFDGCILNGGTGSGKSITGLYYYFKEHGGSKENQEYIPMVDPLDLYIITTAKKRNDLEWEKELGHFLLSTDPEFNYYDNKVVVDSWQNIQKYMGVQNAFFILDEDHVTGHGVWTKAFLKIAKNNRWIILSASPGDKWEDFAAVFIANGFYRNKTEFSREHLVYSRFTKYPKIDRYINEHRLSRLKNKILIDMDFDRHTIPHHEDVYCSYDISKYKDAIRKRWDPYKDEPIEQASGLCYVLRKIVNSDQSRQVKLLELFEERPRMIVFYSFDYEREILLNLYYGEDVEIAEYSGHAHQPIPEGDKWVYIVQYTSGCEGFNCIKTDTIVFYSQTYSYKTLLQAAGRIDRLNSPYINLYYYHLKSRSGIDLAISKALSQKKKFNETKFVGW